MGHTCHRRSSCNRNQKNLLLFSFRMLVTVTGVLALASSAGLLAAQAPPPTSAGLLTAQARSPTFAGLPTVSRHHHIPLLISWLPLHAWLLAYYRHNNINLLCNVQVTSSGLLASYCSHPYVHSIYENTYYLFWSVRSPLLDCKVTSVGLWGHLCWTASLLGTTISRTQITSAGLLVPRMHRITIDEGEG